MTSFYLTAVGLSLIAVLFVVYPLLRARKQAQIELSNANVIKQRIDELAQEVEEGLIDEKEKNAAIRDLKLALVDETPDVSNAKAPGLKVNAGLFLLLGIPALITGAWVYWDANQLTGLNEYKQSQLDVENIRAQMQSDGGQSLTPNDFAKLALSIRKSLRENPDDAQGWSYLALISTSIGRLDEGVAAYEKALDISPQDDQIRFKYAETLMLAGSEESLGNARRQLAYLIGKEPDNRNYRLLMTTIGIQLQEPDLALSNFNLIKDFLREDSQFYQSLVTGLQGLGIQIPNGSASSGSIQGGGNQLAGADMQADNATSNVTQQNELLIQVNIASELQSKLPQDAYLIVFAQINDGSSRAPLAVKRLSLSELPVQVSLSKADAMIPSLNLDTAQVVKVTARISRDRDVMPSAGELEGQILDIDVAAQQGQLLQVTINKELE